MAKQNIKKVKITIPNEIVLNKLKNVPAFKYLSRLDLKLGENIESVNHYQLANQMRMFQIAGAQVEEILN